MVHLKPGEVIGVRVGPVTHVGIVSDRYAGGMPMVISNSHRAGCVAEEPFSVFQGSYSLVSVPQTVSLPASLILFRAREKLGTKWNLFTWNCEHFVHWALGLEPKSPQLNQAIAVAGGLAIFMRLAQA